MSYLGDFTALFFPAYCTACDRNLVKGEEAICIKCQLKLPRTMMHDERGNKLERLFWGRADVQSVTAFLKMPKAGVVATLIHELKYHDNKSIGVQLGKLFGQELKSSVSMCDFDFILPVPLHPKRLQTRGYNQCDCIAEGLEQTMDIPCMRRNLERVEYNASQTRMARYARWKNVETIFAVKNANLLEGKRILLVDDVITTGSTIEACVNVLSAISGIKVSVAAVAMPIQS